MLHIRNYQFFFFFTYNILLDYFITFKLNKNIQKLYGEFKTNNYRIVIIF
jgi:hypothetical protein